MSDSHGGGGSKLGVGIVGLVAGLALGATFLNQKPESSYSMNRQYKTGHYSSSYSPANNNISK